MSPSSCGRVRLQIGQLDWETYLDYSLLAGRGHGGCWPCDSSSCTLLDLAPAPTPGFVLTTLQVLTLGVDLRDASVGGGDVYVYSR